jgi:glutathione S-transferase
MSSLTLGYWDIRGLAQSIRLLLAAAGAEWTDKLYKAGPAPYYSMQDWMDVKFTLPLDFPNLPYLFDGDVKISQSIAIQRYLARKYKLDGDTEHEKVRIDLLEQQIVDYRNQAADVFYDPGFEASVVPYKEGLVNKVSALSKFLGEHHFVSGGGLSHADFLLYEFLDVHRLLVPGILSPHPNLQDFLKRIEELPNVKKYMQSDRFIRHPINWDSASWGQKSAPAPKVEL